MLRKFVLETIHDNNLIQRGERVIIGVSGGSDSVCLLHVLNSLKNELGISIFAMHINHMLRGGEADKDEAYVALLCAGLGIPLYAKSFDIKMFSGRMKMSVEEAGREIRYREFNALAKELNAQKIAVAHNKNDQSETIIMNLLRGTGLDGLKGMDIKRDKLIRPLLNIDRKAIEEYCIEQSLSPRTDESNKDNVYTRNRVRLDLVPYIEKLFPVTVADSIYRMSQLIKEDSKYLEDSANEEYNKCVAKTGDFILIDCERLKYISPAIAKRVIRRSVKELKGKLKDIESLHISSVFTLALSGRTGAVVQLPHNIRAEKSYDNLKLFIESSEKKGKMQLDIRLNLSGITIIEDAVIKIIASVHERSEAEEKYKKTSSSSFEQFFDYDAFNEGIKIRTRCEGDIFKPINSNGTKKLKEYFIDSKIPKDLRGHIPLIAKNGEIIWIIGYKISDKFKVTENTKRVLVLKCEKLN